MKKQIKNELDGRYASTNLQMVYSGKEKKNPNYMRSLTQGVGGLKTQPSSIVSKAGLWAGAGACKADLCFPGRQRGLGEGDKAVRGGEAEAGRGGRGSLFPYGLVGSEHKREPRQSRQASPEL